MFVLTIEDGLKTHLFTAMDNLALLLFTKVMLGLESCD